MNYPFSNLTCKKQFPFDNKKFGFQSFGFRLLTNYVIEDDHVDEKF